MRAVFGQLRARGAASTAARSHVCAATRHIPDRWVTRARRGSDRLLPERSAAPDLAPGRRPDGSFEAIDWDTAIAEVAARFADVSLSTAATRSSITAAAGRGTTSAAATAASRGGTRHPLLLERARPGEDRRVLGRRATVRPLRCHTPATTSTPKSPCSGARTRGSRTGSRRPADPQGDRQRPEPDVDRRRPAAHGEGRARRHPPRPRPGGDADLLAALLAVLVEERCSPTAGWPSTPTGSTRCSLSSATSTSRPPATGPVSTRIRCDSRARVIGRATGGVSIFEDLGIQMAPHSTLNSYLEKLSCCSPATSAFPAA